MKDEFIIEEPNELAEDRVPERSAGKDGIEVDESIDVESIELRSRPLMTVGALGWETARPGNDLEVLFDDDENDVLDWTEDEAGSESEDQFADLQDEHLHLAAELAELRQTASAREAALHDQLAKNRALLREREGELSEQEAQIASLTLEVEGLRAQLSDRDRAGGSRRALPLELADRATFMTSAPVHDLSSVVASLKQRLRERGHALTAAREEVEQLRRERTELAAALAARGSQVAKLLARLRRTAQRFRLHDEFKTGLGRLLGRPTGSELDAAGLPVPGSEEPTLAVDEPAAEATPAGEPAAAPAQAEPAEAPPEPAPPRERRQRTAIARIPARQRRRRTDVGIRRYLIALNPEHEEVCELAERRMYVGRGEEADLRVTDATVSRLHAVLYLERGSTVVEDACSTNGVYVNMLRVRRAVLVDGDTVGFGSVRFQYRVGPAAASTD